MTIQEFITKFAEAVEIEDVQSLKGETQFRELDEWSSLAVMILIAFFDETFSKQIGEKEIRQAQTINDLFKLAIAE